MITLDIEVEVEPDSRYKTFRIYVANLDTETIKRCIAEVSQSISNTEIISKIRAQFSPLTPFITVWHFLSGICSAKVSS